ncbi:hypothetical protein [Ralstonia syzygii]|uniref:hypothetical protein n=1 Tax=Ralstonia syzygii TaxID=28097 RepID=UPI0018D196A8|nr:hypothetical protein [Ralstonia syzygii]
MAASTPVRTTPAQAATMSASPLPALIYEATLEDPHRFVCTGSDGMIIRGGANNDGRSEFGPNSADQSVTMYLAPNNSDLIVEETMQVHMRLRIARIPTGTAQYFSIHRFKRLRK